jgi:hypothetical protein
LRQTTQIEPVFPPLIRPSFIPRNSPFGRCEDSLSFLPFFLCEKIFRQKGSVQKDHMQPFSIKCFKPGTGYPPSSFFILSRGRNTGRPSFSSNQNCFVFSCAPEDLQTYFWMVYAIWTGGGFLPLLTGSVIEFIRIGDMQDILLNTSRKMDHIQKQLPALQKMQVLEIKLKKRLDLIRFTRQMLFSRMNHPAVESNSTNFYSSFK